jgi:hypothetical protein
MYLTPDVKQQIRDINALSTARDLKINKIFDFNNLYYRCCLSTKTIEVLEQSGYQNFGIVKHYMISSILDLKKMFNNGEVIICIDKKDKNEKYWRNYIMEYYKGTRKDWKCPIPKNIFNKEFQKMKEEIKKYFPWKTIKVAGTEADDSMAVFTRHLKNSINIIMSTDSDLQQLLVNDRNYIFEPRKNVIIDHTNNIKYNLFVKFIKGDSGDGIPNIYSDEDTLVNKDKRQKAVRKTLVNEMYNEYQDNGFKSVKDKYFDTDFIVKRFVNNRKLIDLNMIPQNITDTIIDTYNNCVPEGNGNTFMTYCTKFGLSQLVERALEVR